MDVQLPDGTIIKGVPDNMSKEQFTTIARSKGHVFKEPSPPTPVDSSPPPDPREGMSGLDKFMVGAGRGLDRTLRGVVDLVVPEADSRRYLEQGKADEEVYKRNHPGGFATAGEVTADIGLAAGPVGATSKGLMLINALRSTGKFAPAIADVVANASYNAATAPENRGDAAGMGAAGALAPHALVSFMRNFLPRASGKVLDAAREVGSTPTIGQAAGASADTVGNRMLQEAEHLARNIPVVGSMVGRAQEHARSGLNTLIKNAAIDAEEGVSNKVRSKLVKTMQARMGRLEDEGLKQVGAAAALAGTVFATPATAAIAATLIAGYSKPVQVALLQLMRGNDYLVMHLHKNPEAMTQLANVAARMATSTQDK